MRVITIFIFFMCFKAMSGNCSNEEIKNNIDYQCKSIVFILSNPEENIEGLIRVPGYFYYDYGNSRIYLNKESFEYNLDEQSIPIVFSFIDSSIVSNLHGKLIYIVAEHGWVKDKYGNVKAFKNPVYLRSLDGTYAFFDYKEKKVKMITR